MTWEEILQLQPVTNREVQIFKQLPKDEFYDENWHVEEYRHSLIILKNIVTINEQEQLNFSLRWPKKKPNEYKFSWLPQYKNKMKIYDQYKNKILNDVFNAVHLNVFKGE